MKFPLLYLVICYWLLMNAQCDDSLNHDGVSSNQLQESYDEGYPYYTDGIIMEQKGGFSGQNKQGKPKIHKGKKQNTKNNVGNFGIDVVIYYDTEVKSKHEKVKPQTDSVSVEKYIEAYYHSFMKSVNRYFAIFNNKIQLNLIKTVHFKDLDGVDFRDRFENIDYEKLFNTFTNQTKVQIKSWTVSVFLKGIQFDIVDSMEENRRAYSLSNSICNNNIKLRSIVMKEDLTEYCIEALAKEIGHMFGIPEKCLNFDRSSLMRYDIIDYREITKKYLSCNESTFRLPFDSLRRRFSCLKQISTASIDTTNSYSYYLGSVLTIKHYCDSILQTRKISIENCSDCNDFQDHKSDYGPCTVFCVSECFNDTKDGKAATRSVPVDAFDGTNCISNEGVCLDGMCVNATEYYKKYGRIHTRLNYAHWLNVATIDYTLYNTTTASIQKSYANKYPARNLTLLTNEECSCVLDM